MDYDKVLNLIIDDCIEVAKIDYANRNDHLKATIDGLEACRKKDPKALKSLYLRACKPVNHCILINDSEISYWTARRTAIEWTCNVMSACLEIHRLPVIFHPTVKGTQKASAILQPEPSKRKENRGK